MEFSGFVWDNIRAKTILLRYVKQMQYTNFQSGFQYIIKYRVQLHVELRSRTNGCLNNMVFKGFGSLFVFLRIITRRPDKWSNDKLHEILFGTPRGHFAIINHGKPRSFSARRELHKHFYQTCE